MNLLKKLSLPSTNVIRKKPCNFNEKDEHLFKNALIMHLPRVFPIEKKKTYIPPCGRLFNRIFFNLLQFNLGIRFIGLLKSYLKSFFFLTKIRKITNFHNILYVTNSNSANFFHWFLDVLPKIEFIIQNKDSILKSNLKIMIPNGHNNIYTKMSLAAFDLDFYYQKKNEIIVSDKSILLPDIAPSGNYRKNFVLKLSQRLKNHWAIKNTIIQSKKRIYISRKNSKKRRLKNEDEIISILKKYEFFILDFDKINFNEQLKYTLDSEILISIHGSGLTHMLWAKQKSKILEIRTKDNFNDNCYFTLASDLGHDYFYLNADKTSPKISNHLSDLEINKDQFLSLLLKML